MGSRYEHILDSNGRLASTLVYSYNDQTATWDIFQRIQYQYTIGNTPETALTSLFSANGWQPFFRDINFDWYNFDRLKAKSYIRQAWDGSGYANLEQHDCTFGPYEYKRCTTDRWINNAWVPYSRDKALVDTASHYTEQGYETYNGSGWDINWWNTFVNTYSGVYLAESEVSTWMNNTVPPVPTHKYLFMDFALESPATAQARPLLAYPQPARDHLYVQNDLRGPLHLRVYDLQGRLLIDQTSDAVRLSQTGLDVSQVPDGLYLLQVEASKSIHTLRIQMQH